MAKDQLILKDSVNPVTGEVTKRGNLVNCKVTSISTTPSTNRNGTKYYAASIITPAGNERSALILEKHLDRIEVGGVYMVNVNINSAKEVALTVAPMNATERATVEDFDIDYQEEDSLVADTAGLATTR
jgi:hypothetical protein